MAEEVKESIKSVFDELKNQTVIDRGVRCATAVLPYLFPEDNDDDETDYKKNIDSSITYLFNSAVNAIVYTLFPPSSSFVRFGISEEVLQELDDTTRGEREAEMSKIDRIYVREFEKGNKRLNLTYLIQLLTLTGDALIYVGEEQDVVYNLHDFVVNRDYFGNAEDIIVRDKKNIYTFDEDIRSQLLSLVDEDTVEVELYTRIKLNEDKKWDVTQEAEGFEIESSAGQFKYEDNPYLIGRGNKTKNSNYSTSLILQYIKGIDTVNDFSQSILSSTKIGTKDLFFVDPKGTTNASRVAKSKSGDFIPGRASDITQMVRNKATDLQMARQEKTDTISALSRAFSVGIIRDAERVTAAEIRYMEQQLNINNGSIIGTLTQEVVLPYVRLDYKRLQKQKKIAKIDEDLVNPTIVVGSEAMSRSAETSRLDELLSKIVALGPENIKKLNLNEVFTRYAANLGVETDGLFLNDQQVQAQQEEDLMKEVGPDIVRQGMQPQQGQAPQNPNPQG